MAGRLTRWRARRARVLCERSPMCDRFPDKVEHQSATVAANAATLHRWATGCETCEAYPCKDHHHIGHPDPASRAACKRAHPDGVGARYR